MTIDKTEAERIAEAVHCLRPDWVASSIVRLIGESPDLRTRAYRDLAVAFAYIACDVASLTPGRVRENGPWWAHTNAQRATTSTITTRCPDHPEEPAWSCQPCRDEAVDPAAGLAKVRAAIADRPRTPTDHSEPIPARAERADRSKA